MIFHSKLKVANGFAEKFLISFVLQSALKLFDFGF